MEPNRWRLAVFILLQYVELAFVFESPQLGLPRRAPATTFVQRNSTGFLRFHTSPPDPWTYIGPQGRYKLSNYRNPSVKLSWLATFLMTCVGDVFDATAHQGFRPDEPYPDGIYRSQLDYFFPGGSSGVFTIEMTKVDAPDWYMTFSDVVADLEALWYAALWFQDSPTGVPEVDFDVFKHSQQSSGARGTSFLASRGTFTFALTSTANVSHT